jgi:hypothetical protein
MRPEQAPACTQLKDILYTSERSVKVRRQTPPGLLPGALRIERGTAAYQSSMLATKSVVFVLAAWRACPSVASRSCDSDVEVAM